MKLNAKKYNHQVIQSYVSEIFSAAGLDKEASDISANALVKADLRGVWSHGIARTSVYCRRLDKQAANSKPKIKIENPYKSIAKIDGDNGLGLVVADLAIKEVIKITKENGIGLAGIYNSNHFGMAALYLEEATKNDCLCWVFTNASKALPPHGAMESHFGTSPFAFGAPTSDPEKPFILDMASSSVARGKLKFSAQRGEKIPFGLALDKDGNPTDDGQKAFDGIMLPFGGMKGAGISWMMDIAAGIFTGANHSGNVKNAINDFSGPANVGHLMICIKSDLFQSKNDFLKKMKEGIQKVKKLKLAKDFNEILHPGEPEYRSYKLNIKEGISISDDVIDDLKKLGDQYKIKWTLI